ncbi:hypothetical protein ACTFIY_004563 [Dictyostelium cf. discoideum]
MVIYLRDRSVQTPLGIREKVEENNISLKTFQDKNGYNVTCLDGENLCLKGANKEKKQKLSIYVSYSEFWSHIYFIHTIDHSVPYKILKIIREYKLAYPNMYTDVRNYLMVVCPLCAHANIKNFGIPNFKQEEYEKICGIVGVVPTNPELYSNQPKPLNKYRGKETMPMSFLIDPNSKLYEGEPLQTSIPLPKCEYHIIDRELSSEVGTPIIFSPIINKLKLLPSTLNFIPMSVSVPELFTETYLHSFKSLPLYKSNSFVICIGRFNNEENWDIPFYLIIVVDINYIKIDNHYLLNSQPLLQDVVDENLIFTEFELKEHSKKKLIEIVPFIDVDINKK